MSSFCGAWSTSGEALGRALGPIRRRSMVERAFHGRAQEWEEGPLWLAAEAGKLLRGRDWCGAYAGFIAVPGGTGGVLELGEGLSGHYVFALADRKSRSLCLRRDPTGEERLYFVRVGGLILFSTTLKALLGHEGAARRLDPEVAVERALAETAVFGGATLLAGVEEVLPGQEVKMTPQGVGRRWPWEAALRSEEGDPAVLAKRLRERLGEAVGLAIGREGRVAVALSGGLDSSAVAALAAEAVGPDRVEAFTYEFQDTEHPSEVPYAQTVCRSLGLRRHHVVSITHREYLEGIPETVWRAEDPSYWRRSYMIPFARAVERAGFSQYLTGFGIGSHMGYFEDVAAAVPWLPARRWTLRHWRLLESPGPDRFLLEMERGRSGWIHPGLRAPMARLRHPLLCLLRHGGLLDDLRGFYPDGLAVWAERALTSRRARETLGELDHLPLGRRLQRWGFAQLNACVDVTRYSRLTRQVGAVSLSPAHFPSCIPLAFFPPHPRPRLWERARPSRPGKRLLTAAMEGRLPAEILERRKYWPHPGGSPRWRMDALRRMAEVPSRLGEGLEACLGPAAPELGRLRADSLVPLAFWHRLFIEGSYREAPAWSDLS